MAGVFGSIHLPPIVAAPVFALLFWWLAVALGSRLGKLLGLPAQTLTVWERGLVASAIGGGVLQYLPFALSERGWMTPAKVTIGLGVVALLMIPDMLRVARRLITSLSDLRRTSFSRDQLLWVGLLAVMLAGFLVRSVTVGDFGDDDGIHLAAPRRWLGDGTLSYLPSYTHTTATLGFDMLYVIGLSVWNASAAKILHFSTGLLSLLGLVLCGRRLGSPLVGAVAVSLLLIVSPLINLSHVFGSAMIDLAACWMAMTSVLLWLVWRDTLDSKLIVFMALCAGFAISYKLACLEIAFAWTPVLVLEARRRSMGWGAVLKLLVVFGLVSLIPVLPWLYRHWQLTGNPLYPMFSSFFPTRDWTPEHSRVFSRYLKYYSWGVEAGSRLSESLRHILVLITAGLAAAAGLVAWLRLRQSELRALVVFSTAFVVMSVFLTGLIFRYWLPAWMAAALVAGAVYARHRSAQRLQWWPAVALTVVAMASQLRAGFPMHTSTGFGGDLRIATGVSTPDEEYAKSAGWQVWKYLNDETPKSARVLYAAFYTTIGASSYGAYWVDRPGYTTDSHLQCYLSLQDWGSFLDSIDKAGIDYVVISDQQFSAGRHGFSFTAGKNEYPFCRRLVQEKGKMVFKADHWEVHRICRGQECG